MLPPKQTIQKRSKMNVNKKTTAAAASIVAISKNGETVSLVFKCVLWSSSTFKQAWHGTYLKQNGRRK